MCAVRLNRWSIGRALRGVARRGATTAALGAGISMAFAEALSDDGSLTGRGSPWLRGAITGIMTALGGLGHAIPYLVPDSWPNAFWIATAIAAVIVFVELWTIAFVRARLHGYAISTGGVSGRTRRRNSSRGWHTNRRIIGFIALHFSRKWHFANLIWWLRLIDNCVGMWPAFLAKGAFIRTGRRSSLDLLPRSAPVSAWHSLRLCQMMVH